MALRTLPISTSDLVPNHRFEATAQQDIVDGVQQVRSFLQIQRCNFQRLNVAFFLPRRCRQQRFSFNASYVNNENSRNFHFHTLELWAQAGHL
jgi:hypothetical protein